MHAQNLSPNKKNELSSIFIKKSFCSIVGSMLCFCLSHLYSRGIGCDGETVAKGDVWLLRIVYCSYIIRLLHCMIFAQTLKCQKD